MCHHKFFLFSPRIKISKKSRTEGTGNSLENIVYFGLVRGKLGESE